MNKEEAKAKLRKAESDLRQAKVILEMHEQGIQEIQDEIAKLEAIINKKDDWKSVEVPDDIWQALYEEKALLMADMMHFAYARNEGWMPDWGTTGSYKYGISNDFYGEYKVVKNLMENSFIFGVAVKSMAIAEEMLEIFGERIEKFYNKQY